MIDTWDLQEGLLIDARKLQEGLLIYTRDLQLEGYRHIYVNRQEGTRGTFCLCTLR